MEFLKSKNYGRAKWSQACFRSIWAKYWSNSIKELTCIKTIWSLRSIMQKDFDWIIIVDLQYQKRSKFILLTTKSNYMRGLKTLQSCIIMLSFFVLQSIDLQHIGRKSWLPSRLIDSTFSYFTFKSAVFLCKRSFTFYSCLEMSLHNQHFFQ